MNKQEVRARLEALAGWQPYDAKTTGELQKEIERRAVIDITFLLELVDTQAAQISKLEEWKRAILGLVKKFPIYQVGEWAGEKEGWGYVFEVIRYVHKQMLKKEKQIAEGREIVEEIEEWANWEGKIVTEYQKEQRLLRIRNVIRHEHAAWLKAVSGD